MKQVKIYLKCVKLSCNNNNRYFHSIYYYVPETLLHILHILTHVLILTTVLPNSHDYDPI